MLTNGSALQELNSVEVRTVFNSPELTALGKGELMLTIFPEHSPSLSISAKIVSRISCDIFDCVLQPSETSTTSLGKAGIAYMYFTKDGGLKYSVK